MVLANYISTERWAGSLEVIAVEKLQVDLAYQPSLAQSRVNSIASNFDPDLLQAITVNVRTNGAWYVIDGQHRVAAIKKLGLLSVKAWMFYGLSVAEEASLFYKLATQRRGSLPAIARYQSLRAAEDVEIVAIQKVLDEHHLIIGKSGGSNRIAAVNAILWIWREHGEVIFRESLNVILKAYPSDNHRWIAPLLESVAMFIKRYPEASIDRLTGKLQTTIATKVIAEINHLNEGINGAMASSGHRDRPVYLRIDCGAEVLVRYYNHNLRTSRLVSWKA